MEKVKEVFNAKVVEATTFIKGMSIHESEVAFLGLDERGSVLAQHLLNAGVRVRVWEPTVRSPAERQLGGENVVLTKSIADAIKPVQVIFVTLQANELDSITQDEIVQKSFHHKTLVVCTPLSTIESKQLHDVFFRGNIGYVEAAFCGSNATAEKAQLKVLVGGLTEQFEKLKPILSLFGTLHYAGAVPKATALKQAVDLVVAAENAALALATTHLHKQGLNTEVFLDVMGQMRLSDLGNKLKSFELRKYDTSSGSTNDDILIGLNYISSEGDKSGMDTTMVNSLIKYVEKAKEISGGNSDVGSMYDVLNPPLTSLPAAK